MLGITSLYYRKGWLGKPRPKGLKSTPILHKAFMDGRRDRKAGITSKFKEGHVPDSDVIIPLSKKR